MNDCPETLLSEKDKKVSQDPYTASSNNGTCSQWKRKVQFHPSALKTKQKYVHCLNAKPLREIFRRSPKNGSRRSLAICPKCRKPISTVEKAPIASSKSSKSMHTDSVASKAPNSILNKNISGEEEDESNEHIINTSQELSNSNNKKLPLERNVNDSISLETPAICQICRYRKSIENWKPLDGLIYCPKCQARKTPLLRTRTKKTKTTYSTLSAKFMSHCWPFCFIPYLFQPASVNFLHCSKCFKFLGTYNERNKHIRPNEEYVDSNESFQCLETSEPNQPTWRKYVLLRQVV